MSSRVAAACAFLRLASLAAVFGALSGCGTSLPEPIDGCRTSANCGVNEVCVENKCISLVAGDTAAVDSAPAPDTADTIAADGSCLGCQGDDDCDFGGGCVAGACVSGCCVAKPLAAGTTCTTAGACPAPGACSLGLCNATGPACDDGKSCTLDACKSGVCTHVVFADGELCADDGLACTANACVAGMCIATLSADDCLIDGTCRARDEVDGAAPCNRCVPDLFQEGWTGQTSGPCDDGDACTTDTLCSDTSQCIGTDIACDDDNGCTVDSCDVQAGCVHLSSNATCTSDDPCALVGVCKDGNCKPGGAKSCDDGNPCTGDACVEGFGCIFTPKEGNCLADTDPCTDDICDLTGKCVAVPSVSVCKIGGTCVPAGGTAANNPCKICSPQLDSKSWTVLDGAQCNDGNACTSFDACSDGACSGEKTPCNDNNTCTADACKAASGCVYTPTPSECDDNSKCTLNDTCVAGQCVGTPIPAAVCHDANPCTIDQCIAAFGCSNKPAALACDDGDACTKGDVCVAGVCTAGVIVCPCEFDSDCNDKNPCTADKCVTGTGCTNEVLPLNSTCNDNDQCTSNDHCVQSMCLGTAVDCDDASACTKDTCVPEAGCSHLSLQGIACDDADKCTAGDLCLDGKCGGTLKNCDDGNSCTTDGCDGATASCVQVPSSDGAVCPDDNIPCTVDACKNAACSHATVSADSCLIANACLSGGALHPAKQCSGCKPLVNPHGWSLLAGAACKDGDACTVAETCDATGKCVGKTADCDDGNACTSDACNPLAPGGDGCIHSALSSTCDDGDKCTHKDACKAGECAGEALSCEDNNPCTTTGCTAQGGCSSTPNKDGSACPADALACTVDVCVTGYCRHNVAGGFCAIGGACVASGATNPTNECEACIADKSQALWSPKSGSACDDGDPCTGDDTCSVGKCAGNAGKACDDNNPCTADTCTAATGCKHTPTPGTCEDGDLCTTDDSCADGKCVGGNVLQCTPSAKAEQCEVTTCLPKTGCTNVTTCGPLHGCVKGLCLSTANNQLGPVKLAPPPGMATLPLRPSIRWQETASGPLATVPRLWLAAQSSSCSPALGSWSRIFTALFEPVATAPEFRVLKTPSPVGASDWCATHPVLRAHPSGASALVLGWVEGGAVGSTCAVGAHGGQLRVGLAGLYGPDVALSVAAKCPSGAGPQPTDARPVLLVSTAGPLSNKPDPAQLSGLLVRASKAGPLVYDGNVVGDWGGASGAVLPAAQLTGHTEVMSSSRPDTSSWTVGSVLFAVSRYETATTWGVPAVTAMRVDSQGKLASKRAIVLTGVALAGDEPTYHAVEVAYDPDIKRVGVLVSGTVTTSSSTRGFLAFARVHPDQAPLASPKVAVLHDVAKAVGGSAVIAAFRIAEIPGTGDFLVVWVAPGSAVIRGFRIEPKDDSTFKGVDLGALAGNFAGQTAAGVPASSGGLSELLMDPHGDRFSLVWEGAGALYLLTAAVQK